MPAAPDFPKPADRAPIKRALISVSDKTGLIDAARASRPKALSWFQPAEPGRPLLLQALRCATYPT